MDSKEVDLSKIGRRLTAIENALKSRGITVLDEGYDDEGELRDEIKEELKKRRKSVNYVGHEEVKKIVLLKK